MTGAYGYVRDRRHAASKFGITVSCTYFDSQSGPRFRTGSFRSACCLPLKQKSRPGYYPRAGFSNAKNRDAYFRLSIAT